MTKKNLMMSRFKKIALFFIVTIVTNAMHGQVRLPKLISDGMVLQRNATIKIWGWSAPNEKIIINFLNKKHTVSANDNGKWELKLSDLKAGGPFTMKLVATNSLEIKDILIGDVWLCSGQSNMAMTIGQVKDLYEKEIASSENNFIRSFEVPREYEFNVQRTDLNGGLWTASNPKNVLKFSAAAYFFAKKLYEKYKIPIGLVNASYGGTPIHTWLSEQALKPFPGSYNEIKELKNPTFVKNIEEKDLEADKNWNANLLANDAGSESKENWLLNTVNLNNWQSLKVPSQWVNTPLQKVFGAVWFKKEIEVSNKMAAEELKLLLGTIFGADSTYVNGKLVGKINDQWSTRKYVIPANTFIEGKNVITVKIIRKRGSGGFMDGSKCLLVSNSETIDLSGNWKYQIGYQLEAVPNAVNLRWKPTALYNAMIEPLKQYIFKGVLWYQGEGNAGKSKEYASIFPAMINNWRTVFNDPVMPFLYVQLPNYMAVKPNPAESNWALLRESQLKTLAVPHTGMATTIDVGQWNDIHPHQKKEVGNRLALLAQNMVYGDSKVVCYGPMYKSMTIDGNKVILSFDTFGSDMQFIGNGAHTNFAIAGADKKFVWAKATIENGKVIVYSSDVTNPVALRYAWADNPEGEKLYNSQGIPASPFRTDSW